MRVKVYIVLETVTSTRSTHVKTRYENSPFKFTSDAVLLDELDREASSDPHLFFFIHDEMSCTTTSLETMTGLTAFRRSPREDF